MAWAFSANVGSGISESSGTTVTASTTADVNPGEYLFVLYVGDNPGTIAGLNLTNSVRASGGSASNRWIKLIEHEIDPGAAAAGITTAVFLCRADVIIPSSTTITVTLSGARVAKAITLEKFTIGHGMTWRLMGGAGTTGTGTTNPTSGAVNPTTAPTTSRLWIGLCGREGDNDETITQDGTFTNLGSSGKFGTPNLATTSNASAVAGYRISSSDTTETYDPDIGTSRDWACSLIGLDEVPDSPWMGYVLGLSPVALWMFGELVASTSNIFADYAGQNPGTFQVVSTGSHTAAVAGPLVNDPYNVGHRFNATSATAGARGIVPHHSDMNFGNGPFTIMGWISMRTENVNTAGIYKQAAWTLYRAASSDKWGQYRAGTGVCIEETGTTGVDSTYHFLVTTRGASGASPALYKDGVSVGGSVTAQTLIDSSNNLRFSSFESDDGFSTHDYGPCAIWNRVLTADEQLAIYNRSVGTSWRPYRNPMPPLIAQ